MPEEAPIDARLTRWIRDSRPTEQGWSVLVHLSEWSPSVEAWFGKQNLVVRGFAGGSLDGEIEIDEDIVRIGALQRDGFRLTLHAWGQTRHIQIDAWTCCAHLRAARVDL